MGKIKLNLVSGAVVEKPLINAFRANNNSYVVLDNEINGSMGLPIILVCKLDNERLIKISDQGEWQVVKEYLKNIIAGNEVEFISINNELPADDIYYTQLTLPVPSFDALKNAYKVEVAGTVQVTPQVGGAEATLEPNEPIIEPVVASVEITNPIVNEPASVDVPVTEINVTNPLNDVQTNGIDLNTPMPTFEAPVVEPVTPVNNNVVESNILASDLFKEQKEAFMQACENMFDALVQKFKKELENRK